jgi:hypothetical protein
MWLEVSGLSLQLIAGTLLAVPFLFPNKLENFDKSWHTGQGKKWVLLTVWSILGITVITIFGISTYSGGNNTESWYLKLFGLLLVIAITFVSYWVIINHYVHRKWPNWLQRRTSKITRQSALFQQLVYERWVAANRYTAAVSAVILAVSVAILFGLDAANIPDEITGTDFSALTAFIASLAVIAILGAVFSLSALLLSIIFLIANSIIEGIGKNIKRPLWATVIVLFVTGGILLIIGVLHRPE